MGDTVDPVQGAGELSHVRCEAEQADHSVDVDEEDRRFVSFVTKVWGLLASGEP